MNCPDCGSKKISISHRRGSEKFLKYVYPKTPYRCEECWSRFHVFENPFKTWQTKVIAGAVICFLLFIILLPLMRTPSSQKRVPETSSGEAFGIQASGENHPQPPPETPQEPPASGQASDAGAVISSKPDDSSLPFTTEDITDQPATSSTGETSPVSPPSAAEASIPPAGEAPSPSDASSTETASVPVDETPSPGVESMPEEPLSSGGQKGNSTANFFEMKEGAEVTKQTSEPSDANAPATASPEDETVTPPETLSKTPPPASAPEPASAEQASVSAVDETPLKKEKPTKKPLFSKPKASEMASVIPPEKFIAQNKTALKNKKRRLETVTINPSTTSFNAFFKTAPPLKYATLYLTNPARTIINIEGEWEKPETTLYATQNRYVKQVRVGAHPSYLSIVLDMKTEAQMNINIVESKGGLRVSLRP